jgi:hypothetical protein
MNKPFTPLKVSAPVRSCPDVSIDQTRPEERRTDLGLGLTDRSVSPNPFPTQREVWHHLTAGLRMLSANDHGRDWPNPRRDRLAELIAEFDDDLCIRAARKAREIVQVQDRAPNITGLFEKKLRDLAAVRATVRESLAPTREAA